MSDKIVIIRCRADNSVGFGHLVRSRVLAKKLIELGYNTILVGVNEKYKNDEDEIIFMEWIPRESWIDSPTEAAFHIALAKKYNIKYLIMDDYRSDYKHQLLLRQAGLRVLQQYDASKPQRFAANLVINGSPYEKREFYEKDLYSKEIRMLHGPKYAILRPEFLDLPLAKIVKENKILITFGGGDDKGAMLFVLNEINGKLPKKWSIVLVMGSHNPNIEKVRGWIKEQSLQDVKLFVNPNNMPEIIASCKLAILSGGTTTFEAAFLGTPAILMPIATNQYNQGKGWAELGAMDYLCPYDKVKSGKLLKRLLYFTENEILIEKMSAIGKTVVDALGVERVLNILLERIK